MQHLPPYPVIAPDVVGESFQVYPRLMTKKKTGRPLKTDETIVRKLVEGFHIDFTVEESCRYAGIGVTTFYEQMKRDEAFRKEIDSAQDFPFLVAMQRLFTGLKMRSPEGASLALRFLERRQRDRYSPKIIQEHAGEVSLGYGDFGGPPKATSPEEARGLTDLESSND